MPHRTNNTPNSVRIVLSLFSLALALGQSVPAYGFYSWVGRALASCGE
ncbi:MAG: hypothetical protein KC609_25635 [Myxococcales bacterium]|nr:hypothetical protein [Myxococcales bacterium]